MSDFGEYRYVKIRKPHQCVYCGRTLLIGITARLYKGLFQGDWQNWYACGFCVENVEPSYAEPNEFISGDEFSEWLWDSDHYKCKKCENKMYRHHNSSDWINSTHLKISCGDCDNEWIVEIPFESEV